MHSKVVVALAVPELLKRHFLLLYTFTGLV